MFLQADILQFQIISWRKADVGLGMKDFPQTAGFFGSDVDTRVGKTVNPVKPQDG